MYEFTALVKTDKGGESRFVYVECDHKGSKDTLYKVGASYLVSNEIFETECDRLDIIEGVAVFNNSEDSSMSVPPSLIKRTLVKLFV